MKEEKKTFLKGLIVGIIAIIWGYTVVSGGMVLYRRHFGNDITVGDKIDLILAILEDRFVGELDIQAMQNAMFAGLLYGVGDRYTSYMNSSEFQRFLEFARGTYVGIGAVVTRAEDGSVLIVSPYQGSPAYNAGLLPGDRIRKVDGEDISMNDLSITIGMIQGEEGTSVTLTIFRETDNSTFDIDIIRRLIEIPTIFYEMLEDNIGYIRMTGFEGVTYLQFVEAYESLLSDGMEGLILDLRNNPGGRLDVVVDIADRIVPEGLIVYTEDAHGNRREEISDSNQIEIPFVILINGNSASASEVLAGAARDHGVARLVGQQSFGKGLVQDIIPLPDGSAIRVTIATYYTPNGVSIHGYGLTPDYIVEVEDSVSARIHQIEREEDVQLNKAIDVVMEWINN
ncbi:MAG: S41 family peptidase [Defluviitaleaceae bacterium]|nr:S41 family peptidase [Defluviitaleaceae bacterium]